MTLITTSHLNKIYNEKIKALGNINLSINAGEWIAIMGPSGSGKSTLLNLVGCLDKPTGGNLIINGQDVSTLSRSSLTQFRRDHVGLIFQQFHLIPYLTALENVMIAQYYHSMADAKEAGEALEEVGLGDRLHHLPSQLSGGEQQRVCIARALINQPKIILADEPTGNLDEINEQIILRLLQNLHKKGHTILMVTHSMTVGRWAERQLQLEHGHVAGFFLTPREADEQIDDILEHLWILREKGELTQHKIKQCNYFGMEETFRHIENKGYISISNAGVKFSDSGELLAADIMRRHRLAEVLFAETLQMHGDESDDTACELEHTLSPKMVDKICTFLKHPKICPHGNLIPPGPCCLEASIQGSFQSTDEKGKSSGK